MKTLITLCAVISLAGCASGYKAPEDPASAKIDPAKLAEARHAADTMVRVQRLAEEVAQANEQMCEKKGSRLPFALFVSPVNRDKAERDAYAAAVGWRELPLLVALHPSAKPFEGKYVTHLAGYKAVPDQAGALVFRALDKAREGKALELTMADGTKGVLRASEGCRGYIVTEPFEGKTPLNTGDSLEVLPLSFFDYAESDDEVRFLAARSLYFTSSEGAARLWAAAATGRFVRGIADLLTLGVSNVVYNVQDKAPGWARGALAETADAFAVEAAVRAGADPRALVAFAERMSGPALPSEVPQELVFNEARLAALKKVVEPYFVKVPKQRAIVGEGLVVTAPVPGGNASEPGALPPLQNP